MASQSKSSSLEKEGEEEEEEDDSIEGTVFSKSWVLSLLVKLVRAVEEAPSENGGEEEKERKYELDEALENELCLLWDLTVNREIVSFLEDHSSALLLIGCIIRSKYARLTEICLGICNNIVCKTDKVKDFCSEDIINVLLSLLAHSDSNLLLELSRLISTCLTCKDTKDHWIKVLSISSTFLNDICFILSSSTNCDLLRNAVTIIDTVFDADIDLLSKWSSSKELIAGICEALDECKNDPIIVSRLMCVLQLYTTVETGIPLLISNVEKLVDHIIYYLKSKSNPDDGDVDGLMACLSFSHFMLVNFPEESKPLKASLSSDKDILTKLTETERYNCLAVEILALLST